MSNFILLAAILRLLLVVVVVAQASVLPNAPLLKQQQQQPNDDAPQREPFPAAPSHQAGPLREIFFVSENIHRRKLTETNDGNVTTLFAFESVCMLVNSTVAAALQQHQYNVECSCNSQDWTVSCSGDGMAHDVCHGYYESANAGNETDARSSLCASRASIRAQFYKGTTSPFAKIQTYQLCVEYNKEMHNFRDGCVTFQYKDNDRSGSPTACTLEFAASAQEDGGSGVEQCQVCSVCDHDNIDVNSTSQFRVDCTNIQGGGGGVDKNLDGSSCHGVDAPEINFFLEFGIRVDDANTNGSDQNGTATKSAAPHVESNWKTLSTVWLTVAAASWLLISA
jgi:hypothetical protein